MNKSNHKNHFNVTQVRVAFECPRLFYLNYHFQGKTLFIPPEHQKGIGNLFHQQAAQFINLLRNNPEFTLLLQQSPLDKEAIATQIQQLYYELEFFSYLQDNQDKNPELLYLIWQGLISLFKKWSELLINNLQFSNINEVITQTFIDEELSLEYDFVLADNSQQKILGKLDSLVFDLGKQRLCVVEYKT